MKEKCAFSVESAGKIFRLQQKLPAKRGTGAILPRSPRLLSRRSEA